MDRNGIVPLSQLPLSNSFMFGEVMRREEVSTLFLEALLGKKIARIEYIGKEEDLSDDYQSTASGWTCIWRTSKGPVTMWRCSGQISGLWSAG